MLTVTKGKTDGLTKKRVLPFVLALLLLVQILPMGTFAALAKDAEEPNITMFLISDLHTNGAGTTNLNQFITGMQDMKSVDANAAAFLPGGDYTEYGTEAHFKAFYDALAQYNPVAPEATFTNMGNHEMRGPSYWGSYPEEELPYWNTIYPLYMEYNKPYMPETNGKVYYDRWVGGNGEDQGYHIIVMNSERSLKDWPYYTFEQIEWVDEKIQEGGDPTKPVFVVSHQPLPGTTRGSDEDFGEQAVKLREMLAKHANVIFISGHVHNRLGSTSEAVDREFGTALDVPVFRDTGTGYYVEVYDTRIVFKARNFLTSTWLPQYDFVIDTPTMPYAYKLAKEKWEEDYTPDSWAALGAAKAEAEAIFAKTYTGSTSAFGPAVRNEINNINKRLMAGIEGLVFGVTDKTALNETILVAKALLLKTELYPAFALAELQAVIDQAEAVAADESATQHTANVACAALETVITDLTVAVTPVFSTVPQDTVKLAGDTATFSVAASITDRGALSYQWQKDNGTGWTDIDGATAPDYTTGALSLGDTLSRYRCVATNSKYNVTATAASPAATLKVVDRFSTVTFDSNGGSNVPDCTEVPPGSQIGKPDDPFKANAYLVGWYKDEALTVPWNFATDAVNEDTTLYAKWAAMPGPALHLGFEDPDELAVTGEQFSVAAVTASVQSGTGLNDSHSLRFTGAGATRLRITTGNFNYKTAPFTFSMWLNPSVTKSGTQYLLGGNPGDDWIIMDGTGNIGLYYFGSSNKAILPEAIPNGEWTHLGIARSSSEIKWYINGRHVATTPSSSWTGTVGTNNEFTIGGKFNTYTYGYQGLMDEFNFFNSTLTDSQMMALYAGGSPSLPPVEEEESNYALSFDGTLNNKLAPPASVVTVNTANVSDSSSATAVTPEFAAGSKPGKQAVHLSSTRSPADSTFIDLGDSFDYNQSFTLAFRVNLKSGYSGDAAIFSNKNWASGGNPGLMISAHSSGIRLQHTPVGGSRSDVTFAADTVGRWVHIAAVFNKEAGSVTMYVDGEKVNTLSRDLSGGLNGGQNTYIGQTIEGPPQFGNGRLYNIDFLMEDFVLCGGAMNDAEIDQLANPTYAVTVNGGTGGGTYEQGATVSISADTPPAGMWFTHWTADPAVTFEDPNRADTSFLMPGQAVTVTAHYGKEESNYSLSFDGTLNNKLAPPDSVVTVNTTNVSNSSSATPVAPEFAAGSTPGKQAIHLSSTRSPVNSTFINLGDSFDYNQSFTLAFRVNLKSGYTSDASIFSNKNWSSGNNAGLIISAHSTGIRLQHTPVGGSRSDVTFAADTVGRWVHIAAVVNKESGSIAMYVDGVKVNTLNRDLSNGLSGGQNTYIGQTIEGPPQLGNYNIDFLMEDFLLCGGALTDAEIAELAIMPTPTFEVTVNGGTGGGSYEQGAAVSIYADTPPAGMQFTHWTSDPAVTFADPNSADTSFTMPGQAVTVTAHFEKVVKVTNVEMLVQNLVADCKANIPVQVTTQNVTDETVKVRFVNADETFCYEADADANGYAMIKVTEAIPGGDYKMIASVNGVDSGDPVLVSMVPQTGIWDVDITPAEGGLLLTFKVDITFNGTVTVDNVPLGKDSVIPGANTLLLKDVGGYDKIVVSKVKYPDLFPSYSFTFTLNK